MVRRTIVRNTDRSRKPADARDWRPEDFQVEIEPGLGESMRRDLFDKLVELGRTTPDGEWISTTKPKPPGWGEPGCRFTAHLRGEEIPD